MSFLNYNFGQNDILRYLEEMDINQARELGVEVESISCGATSSKRIKINTLESNIRLWAKEKKVLLDEEIKVRHYKYGAAEYNGIARTGSEHSFYKYFSTFKVCTVIDDNGIERLTFTKLTDSETEKYIGHENYNVQNSPSLLQVVYGLMSKYEGIISSASGTIPNVTSNL